MPQPPKHIQSVNRALGILDALSEAGDNGFTLGEISKKVQVNPSTVSHLINTLLHNQVVEQDPISKRYRLGIHLIELGNSARNSTSLARVAGQYIERLWEHTEQACSLLIFHGLMRTILMGLTSRKMLTAQGAPLDATTLHSTGSGKLLLAYLPEQEFQDYLRRTRLQRYTATTITDPEKLAEELDHIRQVGYSLDREEHGNGVRCIAAPVQDSTQTVIGCLDVVFPVFNVTDEQIESWITATCKHASDLSDQLRSIGLVFK